MKNVSWNTDDVSANELIVKSIAGIEYPDVAVRDMDGQDDSFSVKEDEDGVNVLCQEIDDSVDVSTLNMIYYDENMVEQTATASSFIGSHPPHRPK